MDETYPQISDLAEGALPDERVNLVAVHPLLARVHDVVVVAVVVAFVVDVGVHLAFLGAGLVALRRAARSPLLLGVIHLR